MNISTTRGEIDYDLIGKNAVVVQNELNWLKSLLHQRVRYMNDVELTSYPLELNPPEIDYPDSAYAKLINRFNLPVDLRLMLIMSLAPAYQPEVYSVLL